MPPAAAATTPTVNVARSGRVATSSVERWWTISSVGHSSGSTKRSRPVSIHTSTARCAIAPSAYTMRSVVIGRVVSLWIMTWQAGPASHDRPGAAVNLHGSGCIGGTRTDDDNRPRAVIDSAADPAPNGAVAVGRRSIPRGRTPAPPAEPSGSPPPAIGLRRSRAGQRAEPAEELDLGGHPGLAIRPAAARALYVMAHGAGAGMRHEFM